MKILLFNLGSIDNRIFAWGIEGFKTLFENDIILWGPIPEKEFIYNGKEIPILSFFEPTNINSVFDQLPEGWIPDIVTCETSVLNYVPDIYKCPVKTILFTRDAWSDTIFNRRLVELFDFLSHSVVDLSAYNNFNTNILPLLGYAVSIPGTEIVKTEFENREIDVIAIANYNKSFYHDRYSTFYKLAESNNINIRIKFFKGIDRPEIYKYYQRSKIMIDWAHTLSNRSYEAALNGCLLFSQEDNQVIKDFWIPWEEYIPYNENNLFELITFYLANPDKAKNVIRKAAEKMQSIPADWGQYVWKNINIACEANVSIQEREKRIEATPLSSLHYCSATPLLYNYDYNTNYPTNWKELYFERIDHSINESANQDAKIAPIIEASRTAVLLKKHDLAIKYLHELEEVLPNYAWTYYLRARIYLERNENNQALVSLNKAIDCGLNAPELLQKFVLPIIEKGNSCDGRRVTNFMWQSVSNHKNEFQVQAFFYMVFDLIGDIYQRDNDKNAAINSFTKAIGYVSIPDCIYKLNPLLIQNNEFKKLLENTEKGIENSPYDSILVLYKAYALIQLKQRHLAFKILRNHQKALKNFIGVRKIIITRKLISIILPAVIFGKYFSPKMIIEVINILKKRA